MDRFIKTVSAAIGAACGAALTTHLNRQQVHLVLAGLVGTIIGTVVTLSMEYIVHGFLKSSRWGRSMLDPRSVYNGIWLEDFELERPEMPYSIIRLIYDMATKQYKISGKTVAEDGAILGKFESNLVALDQQLRKIEACYECSIRADGKTILGAGLSSFTFDGQERKCATGRGHLFARGDKQRELHFRMVRLDRRFVKQVLGIRDRTLGSDLDRDADLERQIIRAYREKETIRSVTLCRQAVRTAVYQD